jgi:hypothetical protein
MADCTAGADFTTPSSTIAIWPFVGAKLGRDIAEDPGTFAVERDIHDILARRGLGDRGLRDIGAIHEGSVGAISKLDILLAIPDLQERIGVADIVEADELDMSVWPMVWTAASASVAPGIWTRMEFAPCCCTVASEAPSEFTRFWTIDVAVAISSELG